MLFNLDEIFEIAEQIERNGARFYRKTAQQFAGSRAGELLSSLAAWEEEHEAIFAKMRAELVSRKETLDFHDPEMEAVAYLRAIADGQVFNITEDPTKTLTGNESLEEIFKIALGRERDSIAYFLGVKELVPDDLGSDHVDKIIKEEMGHVRLLNERRKELGQG